MRKINIIIALFLLLGNSAWAQTETDTISLKDIDIPSSPAFILLDQTPTTIERPSSSRAFVLSILNSFQDNNGMPKNYAADFTPFWFFKHPNMTSLKFAGYNVNKNRQRIFGNIERASFSFAFITTTDTLTQKPVNNLSLGLRVNLISIRSKKDIDDIKNANKKLIAYIKERDAKFQEYQDSIKRVINDTLPLPLKYSQPAIYKQAAQDFFENYSNGKESNESTLKEILARKPVFAIDGALGYNTFFLDNKFSENHFGRLGVWLTLNYAQPLDKGGSAKNYFNLYAIGRYLSDGTTIENGNYKKVDNYDVGGKIEFELKKISIGYEYIYRVNNISNTFRSNGLLKYKVSDQVFLTGAFGKNFGDSNNLISLLGINWGFSTGNEKATVKE
ncbi:MAG: hypothetical protein QM654_04450 [Dysgonamonadaceae bacterium]